jgi:hypothetical protein
MLFNEVLMFKKKLRRRKISLQAVLAKQGQEQALLLLVLQF